MCGRHSCTARHPLHLHHPQPHSSPRGPSRPSPSSSMVGWWTRSQWTSGEPFFSQHFSQWAEPGPKRRCSAGWRSPSWTHPPASAPCASSCRSGAAWHRAQPGPRGPPPVHKPLKMGTLGQSGSRGALPEPPTPALSSTGSSYPEGWKGQGSGVSHLLSVPLPLCCTYSSHPERLPLPHPKLPPIPPVPPNHSPDPLGTTTHTPTPTPPCTQVPGVDPGQGHMEPQYLHETVRTPPTGRAAGG